MQSLIQIADRYKPSFRIGIAIILSVFCGLPVEVSGSLERQVPLLAIFSDLAKSN